jgi:ankyrin repeat protein
MAASAGADSTLLEKILKLGASIDAIDASGSTPLCYAAGAGHTEVAHWLIDRGANVAVGDEKGTTPVSQAVSGDHFDLAKHLIDRGALSTLHQAVQCGHLIRARQKLNAGADANHERDRQRLETPIVMAIWNDSVEMVKLLLEYGADPNRQDPTEGGGNTIQVEACAPCGKSWTTLRSRQTKTRAFLRPDPADVSSVPLATSC